MNNPALNAFVAAISGGGLAVGQIWISREGNEFLLRHCADGESSAALRSVSTLEVRSLVQFTENGVFRPLKSAPNLKRGWVVNLSNERELGMALDQIYPGAIADWFAAQNAPLPVVNFREFTHRQTGMYRTTSMLDDSTAGALARACCHSDFCLKRRFWTAPGASPDPAESKSLIPCLSPCAILLEFARKISRLEQDAAKHGMVAEESVVADPAVVETDFDSPRNPRRVRFVLEKRAVSDKSK